MKHIALILTACLIAGFTGYAHADPIGVGWTLPSRLTDGRSVPTSGPEALKDFYLEWWTCSGAAPNYTIGAKVGESFIPANPQSYSTPALPPNLYCLRISARQNNDVVGPPTLWASKLVVSSPIDGTTIIINITNNAGGTVSINLPQ